MAVRVRHFGYLGVLLLVLTAALLVVFGFDSLDAVDTVQVGSLLLAGLLAVAGGFPNPFRERIGALRLVGTADICLGVSVAASAVTLTDVFVLRAAFVLGSLCIVLIGANYVTNGRLFETELPAV